MELSARDVKQATISTSISLRMHFNVSSQLLPAAMVASATE
jgi:hypothetical protein